MFPVPANKPSPMTTPSFQQPISPMAQSSNLFTQGPVNFAHPNALQGPYQTPLDPQSEWQFRNWARTSNIPYPEKYKSIDEYISDPHADYDLRGYWQAQQAGNPMAIRAPNQHFPDYWKTPYHEAFSNESKWAAAGAPHWNDKNQLISPVGSVVFDENKKSKGGSK